MYKIMFSAGEASGDLHGAQLAAALHKLIPDLEMTGFGGQQMAAAGVRLYKDMRDYSVMGFAEVVRNLPRLVALKHELVRAMRRDKPDVLVIIDYPDFNWRLAREAKSLGIAVFSYIPPSAWAWRSGRAKSCAVIADEIDAIFPFEMEVYERAGANIFFNGNPLVDTVKSSLTREEARKHFKISGEAQMVLLLPGSRAQEIKRLLPAMLASAKLILAERPDTVFFLPVAQGMDEALMQRAVLRIGVQVAFCHGQVYELMQAADFALATSGTVVLEAALLGLPCVILYRMSALSYLIAQRFIHLHDFSLPNILAGKSIQPELLQSEVNAPRIVREARRLYKGSPYRSKVKQELAEACKKLGGPGAAERTAQRILALAAKSRQEDIDEEL